MSHRSWVRTLGESERERERETEVTPVGFEPTPFRTGALSQRLRPLGQSVLREVDEPDMRLDYQTDA